MKIRYTNPLGKVWELDAWPDRKDYILQSWEGFGEVPVTLQTSKSPYQDGVTLVDQLLEPRHLSLEVVLYGPSKQQVYEKRRFIQNIFNPKLGLGKLEWIQPNGDVYAINVIPESSPSFPAGEGKSNSHQIAIINLMAPDPAWLDTSDNELLVSSVIGKFNFPISFPTQMGVLDNERIITNRGDMPTPVRIVFNGPAENPKIANETTGDFIKVARTLLDDEQLIVDTTFGAKQVIFIDKDGVESNAFGSIDLESQFWWLEVGDNKIVYTSDSGGSAATVHLFFKQRYVGV